jgi:hypothetical protein
LQNSQPVTPFRRFYSLEQDYDTPGDEAPRPRREDDFHPEQLMHELEDFLRQERDRGAE